MRAAILVFLGLSLTTTSYAQTRGSAVVGR